MDIEYKNIESQKSSYFSEEKVIKPIDFIEWAKFKNIPVKQEIIDWVKKYDKTSNGSPEEDKPMHHKTKDSYKRAIATFGLLYFKSKTKDNFNANNLYKLTKGSAKFQNASLG